MITTCKASRNNRLKVTDFQRVIIDEATKATELETFLPLRYAKQLVLIGDPKQLCAMTGFKIDGPDSAILRLSQLNDYLEPNLKLSVRLNVQYRMKE